MRLKLVLILIIIPLLNFAQNPNDCVNAIVICGDSSIGLEPNGIGFDEFTLPGNIQPECYFFDQHNIWFKFNIISSGTFMFDLIPDDGADYDFAIFGPVVDCTTLSNSIRCSSTNPEQASVSANTGLNMEETDLNEGPGEDGNGYLRYIDAQAGDVYYLLVDRAVGSGGFGLFYTGTATLPAGPVANTVTSQQGCDSIFNLDALIPTVAGAQNNVTVTFHSSLNDANIGINSLVSPYTSTSSSQTIFVRIESINGCTDYSSFIIEAGFPTLSMPADVVKCSQNPTLVYFLSNIVPEIINDPAGYIFSYHNSQSDADDNINPIGNAITLNATSQTIFVRVTDQFNSTCYDTTSFSAYIIMSQPASTPEDIVVCDIDFDGISSFDFSEKDSEVLGGLPTTEFQVYYYSSEADRLEDINRIVGSFENISNPQTIYISLFEIATGCFNFTQFDVIIYPKPLVVFSEESYLYCLNSEEPLEITVLGLYPYYVWSNGEEGADKRTIFVTEPGNYTVTAINQFGCENSASVQVMGSDVATIIDFDIVDFRSPLNSIAINVEGPGDYEFALNQSNYFKADNTFEGLGGGFFTAFVRDKNGCGIVSQEVLVLDYMKFFTPNGDGYNDFWQINGIEDFPNSELYIFDRFGKLIKHVPTASEGWDGTNNQGKGLPTNDYWFRLELEDGRSIKRHFTLKRY
jgi:gliding motility-associated-like protein